MANIKITSSKYRNSRKVFGADDDMIRDEYDSNIDDIDAGFNDKIDDVADAVEDIQDTIEQDKEDPINIEIENNISDHYIAECEKCQGVFISATIESDQKISKVTGECPLCGEESDQYLKWVIKPVSQIFEDPEIDKSYMYN